MKTKRVYIAGKITGEHTADVWYKFYLCECELKDAGYKVVNPLRLCESHWNWWRCMSVCLFHLVFRCNAICLLPDWQKSKGARIEFYVAKTLNKLIIDN